MGNDNEVFISETATAVYIEDIALEAFRFATLRRLCPCSWGHYCVDMESALDQLLPSDTTGRQTWDVTP